MSNIKIVSDSAADLVHLEGIDFAYAPLKISTAEKEYVDDSNLNVEDMITYLECVKLKSQTACPAPGDFISAFGNAKNVICFTITSGLSGSYNSAINAKEMYEAENPESKVFVVDSLSAGPGIHILIEKAKELINEGLEFEDVCAKIMKYKEKTGLIFMLSSLRNLANNGRVSQISAKLAEIFGIRVIGKASAEGKLEQKGKKRGDKNALNSLLDLMETEGYKGESIVIGHCCNESLAKIFLEKIKVKYGEIKNKIYQLRGLCSFYAERNGLLVAFEK